MGQLPDGDEDVARADERSSTSSSAVSPLDREVGSPPVLDPLRRKQPRSGRVTDVFNLFDGELDEERDRPGWSWRRAKVGDKIGAEKLGASLYELDPGEKTYPDSGKIGIWTGNDADPGRLFRIDSAVDYWDGEP